MRSVLLNAPVCLAICLQGISGLATLAHALLAFLPLIDLAGLLSLPLSLSFSPPDDLTLCKQSELAAEEGLPPLKAIHQPTAVANFNLH